MKKALEKKNAEEEEKKIIRKRYEEKLRMEMEKYRQELAILVENQKKEDEQFKAWEIKQRLERDKFNNDIKIQDYKREKLKKEKIANTLRKQIVNKFIYLTIKLQLLKNKLQNSIINFHFVKLNQCFLN